MSDLYTLAEEVAIGSPIPLEPDALPCDLVGCSAMAALLIPGAAICRECWEEHLDDDDRYYFPAEDLVGDERWRDARRNEYRERVALMSPRRRDAQRDSILAEQVAERVEHLLRFELGVGEATVAQDRRKPGVSNDTREPGELKPEPAAKPTGVSNDTAASGSNEPEPEPEEAAEAVAEPVTGSNDPEPELDPE
jgi:hypothetical protein